MSEFVRNIEMLILASVLYVLGLYTIFENNVNKWVFWGGYIIMFLMSGYLKMNLDARRLADDKEYQSLLKSIKK